MKIKILLLKTWSNKTITPLAWQRIVIKSLNEFRSMGHELRTLEEPNNEVTFGDKEYDIFAKSLKDLYDMKFPEEILEKVRG
jgi:hypothetical protein